MDQERIFQQVHIALIEDDEDDYVLIEDYLSGFRWAVATLDWADNYADGLQMMAKNRHDAYLLDYQLGGQTGLDLLRAATAMGCKGPVIVLTGQGDHQVDLAVMESGAVDYLIKEQIDAETLERAIRYAIHRKWAELELAEMQCRLADSREQEQLALARDLHDGPLQELLGIRLYIGALRVDTADTARSRIDQILDRLQQTIDTLRDLCGELRPPALSPFGLDRAIRSHIQQFCVLHDSIQVDMDLDEDQEQIDEQTRRALYRIFQTAMANVVNHAQAQRVRIIFHINQTQIVLQIEDNGRGFSVPKSWMTMARRGHYGLLGATERAQSIGGRLLVHSKPGQGTAVIVVAPHHFSAESPAGSLQARDKEIRV